ncbi:MAG: ABC transporter ATP-binding protein [Thermoleophilia bacterium]|nr:ABC transporter ATP-binding protein [Thermoleophilia bacterium]
MGGAEPATVAVDDVVCKFEDLVAVDGVSLETRRGEFLSLLGPSGCGKTTLLRTIAGLVRQESGRVLIDGTDVSAKPAHMRNVGLVFQRYALFPHKSVEDNVGFPLMLRRVPRAERRRRVEEMLDLVHLSGYGGRSVEELSGGQAQRVALARVLVDDPPVLLLDEPLTALDLKLRQAMQAELRQIQRRVGSTFIYVTHDQGEALVMSDRIGLMSEGKLVQLGTPSELYKRPKTLFAATFIGEANLFAGRVATTGGETIVDVEGLRFALPANGVARDGEASICLRPEQISIGPASAAVAASGPNQANGEVIELVFAGPIVRWIVQVGPHQVVVERPAEESGDIGGGDVVRLSWERTAPVLLQGD